MGSIKCDMGFPIEVLVYATITFFLSIVAIAGAAHANRRLLGIYAWGLFGCIVLLLGFSAFMFVLSKVSTAQTSKHHNDYELNGYPSRLRAYAVDGDRWISVKKCMVREQICERVPQKERDERGDLWIEEGNLQVFSLSVCTYFFCIIKILNFSKSMLLLFFGRKKRKL